MDSADRTRLIRQASIIALIGNAALSAAKLVVGVLTGSLAVISDGVDSASDVAIAVISLFAASIAAKPCDTEHPYGHFRAETIATTVLAFTLFFAGAQLFVNALSSLFSGGESAMPELPAIVVTAVSIIGKLLLSSIQFRLGKLSDSALLIANGKNMAGDIVTSASVLIGLSLGRFFGIAILDRVLALLVSLWIIKTAISVFIETNTELMEGNIDKTLYSDIFSAVAMVPAALNPHRARLRRLGSYLYVDLDIEVDPAISVSEAHDIAIMVECAIKERLPSVVDVMVHVEPKGNIEDGEAFGLSC